MTRNQRLANLEVDHMSAHNPTRDHARKGVDRTGYVPDYNQIILNDNSSPFPSVDGPEQSFILVENVETPYDAHVFYPDKSLFNYFISRGLSKADAETLLPLAHRALSDLCGEFLNSAVPLSAPDGLKSQVPVSLPDVAPELYLGNRGGAKGSENIIEFLRRVWMPWIDAGILTRSDLKKLDVKAYRAVFNWIAKEPLPSDITLPTRSDTVTAEFGIDELTREQMEFKMRESERLASALRRRLEAA
jgi:hypothetical protein